LFLKPYPRPRYHVQVLFMNKLWLHFKKFSKHEKFDCNLGAEVQSMRSTD